MRKILISIFIPLIICMAGCAVQVKPPDTATRARANYGAPMTPQLAATLIKGYFDKTLLDPYSAVYEMPGSVSHHWMIDKNGDYYFGYSANVSVNAKNRMGGYTGSKDYIVVFYQGQVVKVCEVGKYDVYPDPYVFPTQLIGTFSPSPKVVPEPAKLQQKENAPAKDIPASKPSKESIDKLCGSMSDYALRIYKNRESVSVVEQKRRAESKTADKPAARALMFYSIEKAFSLDTEGEVTQAVLAKCNQVAPDLIIKQVKKEEISPVVD